MAQHNPIIFYDGECALCHGFVLFVLKHDKEGVFSFSPLQGDTIKTLLSENERAKLPDSVVMIEGPGSLKVRSEAAVGVMKRLQGWPRIAGKVIAIVPLVIRNFFYDVIASIRKKIFGTKSEMCPIVPDEIRARFLP